MTDIIKPAVDSWVEQEFGAQGYPNASKLRLRGTGTSKERQAFMFFGRPFPLGASVFDAKLRLYVDEWTASSTVTIKRVTQSWREGRVQWNDRPAVVTTDQVVQVVPITTSGAEIVFNLTAMMAAVSAGQAWHGLRIEISTDTHRSFHSSDAEEGRLRPKIEVDWRVAPFAPTNLRPSGAGAVSIPKPILKWEYGESSRDGEQLQAYSRVQVSTVETFATIEYDSAKTANLDNFWNLASTAYAGVPAAATRYWRVMVWDDASLSSPWSDPAEFSHTAKPTLAITNPPAPPSNTVEETTPPITWTVTGGTQKSFELLIERVDDNEGRGVAVFWPRTLSSLLSQTVTPKFLKTGKTYKATLKVWDNVDRAWSNGDPPYLEATRTFTYVRSGVPAAVTSLTATVAAGDAKVRLSWDRVATPDYFSLRVDGVEVEDRLDPADFFVVDHWEMDYWGADPRVTHTYEIEAVVANLGKHKHSDDNATATAKTTPTGIWLIDTDDSTYVRLVGPSDVDLEIREVGETFEIAASREPVRITEQIGGYRGSVSGQVEGKTDRDTLLDLKGRQKELWVIAADLTLPVRLEEITVNPSAEVPDDTLFPATINLFQSGRFAETFLVRGG